MTFLTLLLLLAGAYLGGRWLSARAENARLLEEIAMLRRRLAARRTG